MITFLTVIHICTIIFLVIAVLLQSGKGAEISATFGGSSQTVFGSSGGANFFQKLTYSLAFIFMCTSLTLTILPSRIKKSVFEGYTPPASAALPKGETNGVNAAASVAPAPAVSPAVPLGAMHANGKAAGTNDEGTQGAGKVTNPATAEPAANQPGKH
jgi:preprotein translocase subunit SecG